MFDLHGKTVLITGSSRGIGRAALLAMAQQGACVIMHCSRPSAPADETVAALEAMECALPLVMTDVGAGADLASGCGECVPPGDAGTLCEALYRLMTDDAYRCACGGNARRRAVTEFDLTRQTQELLALYEKENRPHRGRKK